MMRGFALLAGLLLGLAGAIAWGGRLAHLRALADLPGWTQGLDADSGLFAGSGTLDDAALRWVWTAGSGWVVTLSGRDWQAQGRAHPRPDGVRIDALSGLVPLALLTGGAGALAVERGTLALVVRARLPLTEALRFAGGTLDVARFRLLADEAGEALRRGESLSQALARLPFLHPVARQLVQAGEASARLAPMSERAAVLAESWLRTERKRVTVIIEPASMVIVGGMVLVIVLAILLPIFDMQALVTG